MCGGFGSATSVLLAVGWSDELTSMLGFRSGDLELVHVA